MKVHPRSLAGKLIVTLGLALTLFVPPLVRGQSAASAAEGSYPFCATDFATLGGFVAGGSVTFDTDALTFGGVPGGVNAGGVAVFAFDSIQIPLGTTVVGQGSRPLALLSITTVQIDGTVIVDGQSATNFTRGPFLGGPGGGASSTGPGRGLFGSGFSGSGGAGFGGLGGAGGTATQGGVGGAGGTVYGDLALTIEGGSGGANAIDDTRTGGGGGGGGLFISSLSGLTIGSSGIVSGDGGDGAVSGFGASGGGSGGGIVLFDPVVTNDGTVHADGGDGGKGGGFGAGGGGGGGRILVAGAPAGTGTYSLVGGQTGICCPSGQSPGQLGEDGAGGVLTIDPDAFPKCAVLTNSFLVYDTRVRPPKFESREVMLADQFETGVFEVESLELLGNPADLNDEGITNSDTHMVGYEIEPADDAEHVRVTIRVTSRFGEIVVDTVKPDRLLVPSAKSLGNPVDPLDPGADHFKCYRVELAEGPPEFTTEPVFVQDQFIGEPKLFDVEEPIRLCNPVDKNGEGIADADTHLMCFKVKPADGEPGFKMVRDIHTNNQFGPLQMVAIAEEELCVPSEIEIVE